MLLFFYLIINPIKFFFDFLMFNNKTKLYTF